MKHDGGFVQACNGQIAVADRRRRSPSQIAVADRRRRSPSQIAVDEEHQIIVAAALSNQAPDAQYLEPMLRRVVDNCNAYLPSPPAMPGTSPSTTSALRSIWDRAADRPAS